jgi:pyruvate dehydrogenase E1 component alpha subunit
MGQTNSRPGWLPDDPEPVSPQQNSLRDSAVAVDPPPAGAVGIRELLARLEVFNDDTYSSDEEADKGIAFSPSSSHWDLGELADPKNFTGPLEIENWAADQLKLLLSNMISIRKTEQALATLVEQGHVTGPAHLAIGQEAIPVGISKNLTSADRVFGGPRSHGHYLAMGGELYSLFAEILGKQDGCSGGLAGSTHLNAPEQGFWGSAPVVGATVSIAVGAALAARMDGSDAVAVAHFDNEAVEQGSFHESLNLASKMKLPILFVCENNLGANHSDCAARFADANGIDWAVIDGNDAVSMAEISKNMIENTRKGLGPAFLEAVTYRWNGLDEPDQSAVWKRRDPITRLKEALMIREMISEQDFQIMEDRTDQTIMTAVTRAIAAPCPTKEALLGHVYTQPTA